MLCYGGDLTEGFLRYRFGGLIFGGAYTWRGLFSEFYGIHSSHNRSKTIKRRPCHRLFQTSRVRVEPFSYVRTVFFSIKFALLLATWVKTFFFLGGDWGFFNVLDRSIRRTPTFLSTRNHQYATRKKKPTKGVWCVTASIKITSNTNPSVNIAKNKNEI